MIPCQRHLFDIPDDVAYLNCAYLSPLMHSVREAGVRGVDRKVQPWKIHPEDFFTEADLARSLFARLIGATGDDIAIVPAASYGAAVAAANIVLPAGSRVVVIAEQHASNVLAWRELAARCGAEVHTIPRPEDEDWTRALLATIDERVSLVAVPPCHWTDGGIVDVVAIGARCREVGAAYFLDLTQATGVMPFDVAEVQPDFAVTATYKWLLGPYTLGFLYVAPHRQAGQPIEHSMFQRALGEQFGGPVVYPHEFQAGARRFDMGERANFALMPMAMAAIEQLLDWGVAEIATTLGARTRAMAERAAGLGFSYVPHHLRAGHFLGLRMANGLPEGLIERLAAANVMVSLRGGTSLRITPHLWNNDADVDRLFEALAAAL